MRLIRTVLGILIFFAVLFVPAGRFGWSSTPLILRVPEWLGLGVAFGLAWWSLASNPFASRLVRIQEERGHRVATLGPYRYVRHPMYVGVILCAFCIPVVLGS
jgi:protein-S-isoprenylcysteine O-methyltransferase Ste14